jgi:hypothetical protein
MTDPIYMGDTTERQRIERSLRFAETERRREQARLALVQKLRSDLALGDRFVKLSADLEAEGC